MSFLPLPRAQSAFIVAGLALTIAGCKGGENLGPDKKVAIIEIEPKNKVLYAIGQQVTFTTTLTTEAGTTGAGIEVGYTSKDPSLVQVNSQGVATVKAKGGTTYIVSTAGGKSDSARVEVLATTCGSIAPTTMVMGQVITDVPATGFCAAASTGEYTVILHNNSTASSGSSSIELVGIGLGTAPLMGGASLSKAASTTLASKMPLRRDVAAELRHRRGEILDAQASAPGAREWYATRSRRATFNAAPPAVGDIVPINVNLASPGGCENPNVIQHRVAAVSNSAIVLADPRNPPFGYTDAEYNEYAQVFDSIINPLDVANFGAPTDLDGNGRIILVFTRAVNERTPANSNYYVGGLTHSRDLEPRTSCAGSNQGEMFYLLVPDSTGVVNGNDDFTKGFVNQVTEVTIAHEFQHLINFARRKYILPAGTPPSEELWLNEGLSHIAEELLFYRRAGRSPRGNYSGSDITSQAAFRNWVYYMAGNFINYDEHLFAPATTSPFESGDEVATRGSTWAFLRFVADQKLQSDGNLWYNLVNMGETGQANLRNRLGITEAELKGLLRDFTVSVYADDHVFGVPARFTQPSWNQRSFYPLVAQATGDPSWNWPLPSTPLNDADARLISLQAGGYRVFRFRGISGVDAFVRAKGFDGAPLPAGTIMTVIRTQ